MPGASSPPVSQSEDQTACIDLWHPRGKHRVCLRGIRVYKESDGVTQSLEPLSERQGDVYDCREEKGERSRKRIG